MLYYPDITFKQNMASFGEFLIAVHNALWCMNERSLVLARCLNIPSNIYIWLYMGSKQELGVRDYHLQIAAMADGDNFQVTECFFLLPHLHFEVKIRNPTNKISVALYWWLIPVFHLTLISSKVQIDLLKLNGWLEVVQCPESSRERRSTGSWVGVILLHDHIDYAFIFNSVYIDFYILQRFHLNPD
jgi:hypothetical protein